MTKHVLLDNITHKDLRIRPGYGRGMGFEVNVARVFPIEFTQLQMEYPIVLMRNRESGHFEPIVLFGFAEAENLFVTDDGWDARYVPLTILRQPLALTNNLDAFDIKIKVHGGGISGQAGAVRHGITKALIQFDPDLRPALKRAGFVKRDPREKERKKYGQKGARARFQFSKR